ncbi:MAG TPA: VanZ family protein [bacterium]|nr:VanZ family protein [bacterium]
MNKKIRVYLPTLLYAVLLFLMSSISNLETPDLGFEFKDKVYHLGAYGIFGFLLARSGREFKDRFGKALSPIVFAAGALFALSDEIHQYFVPGRHFELLDLAADWVGIILGQTVYGLVLRKKKARHARGMGRIGAPVSGEEHNDRSRNAGSSSP